MDAGGAMMGPAPPMGDDEYDPEDIKKAEEYKKQGNDYVKGKFDVLNFCAKNTYLNFCTFLTLSKKISNHI